MDNPIIAAVPTCPVCNLCNLCGACVICGVSATFAGIMTAGVSNTFSIG